MAADLTHHGIEGMKWGIRRYRGSDGRIVPGKYIPPAKAAQLRKEGGSTPTTSSSKSTVKTPVKEMTTAQLKEAVERLNLERQYKQLSAKEISPGMKFVNSVLADSGKKAATSLTTKYMIKGGDVAIQKMIKTLGGKK